MMSKHYPMTELTLPLFSTLHAIWTDPLLIEECYNNLEVFARAHDNSTEDW